MTCPGCNGQKSRRAQLCASCRRRANAVGAKVWTQTAVPATPATPRTSQQSRIYYGKCAAIAHAEAGGLAERAELDRRMRDVKRRTLVFASQRFRRPIESSTELSDIEMDIVLEHLDDVLDELPVLT